MTMNRRLVIKSLAAAGITLPQFSWAHASNSIDIASNNVVVVPLVCTNRMAADFLAGVQSAADKRGWAMKQAIHLQGLDSKAYQGISHLVHRSSPVVLVGLLDDAWKALLLGLVRSEGGQMLPSQAHNFCCTFNMDAT